MKRHYLVAIAAIILLSVFFYFFTRFTPSTLVAVDGFFVSENKVGETLLSETRKVEQNRVALGRVSADDIFYQNRMKIYVGENHKKEVNTTYPIYTNKGAAIVNLSAKSKLINRHFEFFKGYENAVLTGGLLYNLLDATQSDYEQYILLQLEDLTYVNLTEIVLTTDKTVTTIPVNSILNFEDGYIKYYAYQEGVLVYHYLDGVKRTSQIKFKDIDYLYETLLLHLDKINKEETTLKPEKIQIEESYLLPTNAKTEENDVSPSEKKYVKPTVSCEKFSANVYSATATLKISDPSAVIIGGINFQFKIGDKIFLRKVFISSGKIEVPGLVPNTEFTIIGSYKYYNEEKKKMEVTFFEQQITTQGTEKLEPIELSFSNGKVYSNKLEVKDIAITSNLDSETIKGVSKGIIYINEEKYTLSASLIKQLITGKSVTYTSPNKLSSNSTLHYEIELLDNYNNQVKIKNNKGSSRTSKEVPSSNIKIIDSSVNETVFSVTLKNKDKVTIHPYRYVVYNKNGEVVLADRLDPSKETMEVTLKDMDPNTVYSIQILGDFDIEDGQGVLTNQLLGEGKFTTMPLSSLGYLRVNAKTTELTAHKASFESALDTNSVSPLLIELLDTFVITVMDEKDNTILQKELTKEELNAFKAGQVYPIEAVNLTSMTTYRVTYKASVKQGSSREEISVLAAYKSFKTYKEEAQVALQKKFVNGNMIDFDVKINDIDGAIESKRVLLEVRDATEKLIAMESISINKDYKQLTYEKLEPDQIYTFTYKVEEYNIGYDNSTYQGDYTLYKETITTEEGIKGELTLTSLLRQIEGENLFNIEDYERIRSEGNNPKKEYDLKNRTVTFSAKNGYANLSYFLPEAKFKKITITFLAKYAKDSPGTAKAYLANGYANNKTYELTKLNKKEWQEYTFSFALSTDYIGFLIDEVANENNRTDVMFKDIMIYYNDYSEAAKDDVSFSYHKSGYRFKESVMLSGAEKMPSHEGVEVNLVGNYGHGYARITNLQTNTVTNFSYTGTSQEFIVPSNGEYKIELWGAGGGDGSRLGGYNTHIGSHGGRGAYTAGVISLSKLTKLYFYVGGQGNYGSGPNSYGGPVGGYNGGGNGGNSGSGSGGGATDVRLTGGTWNNTASLESRIMVASGGGGADDYGSTLGGSNDGSGGVGGTLVSPGAYIDGVLKRDYFASQTYGYKFGIGGNVTTSTDSGGGGGGYYGGMVTNHNNGGASGGSSYISGYLGCVAIHLSKNTIDDYVPYEEKDTYQATVAISLADTKEEISSNDYYIQIYQKGKLMDTLSYDLVDHKVINLEKVYDLAKNKEYTLVLAVKIRDRFYSISSLEFNTNSEIRSIRTTTEFYAMHPNGKYIVLNDLDFTKIGTVYSSPFYGSIDFQGHCMKWNVLNRSSYLFHTISAGALLENIVMDVSLDNTASRSWFYGLSYRNYGMIDNLIVTINESLSQPNYVFNLITYINYGTIQNFIINAKKPVYVKAATGLLVWSNQGTIKNGYVYGENIQAYYENNERVRKDIGVIAGEATTNSKIENVFSLISVEVNANLTTETQVGNLIGYSATGSLKNAYSVESSDKVNTNIVTKDPNIGFISAINSSNLYYISDKTYKADKSDKVSKLALADTTFQEQTINKGKAFTVDAFVSLGYYPQLKLNDCMPNQEWIALPKIEDKDLLDVTSVEEVSNGGDSAVVKLHLNNPGAEKITALGITDIVTTEIISQENSWGKTELVVKLSNPIKYTSKYYIREIKAITAYGTEDIVTFGQYERGLNIDLYYPITSLADFKKVNQTPTQNYILKTDLDFKGTTITNYVVTNTFSGKLNGAGHTLKNITINSSTAMFNKLTGTLENLFIENYTKTNNSSYGGFIYTVGGNANIDNVHLTNAKIKASTYIGGLVGYGSDITISNSSVTAFTNDTVEDLMDIRIGGIAGYLSNSTIRNSFTKDLAIKITDSQSTYGIGGIIGEMGSGTIENVYTTGTIQSNSANVGGIVGYGNCKLTSAISAVDIISELDYVGGIVGKTNNTNISNTLVTGAIYSSYQGQNIHRTIGNAITMQNNYAWSEQPFYGYITGDVSGEKLLTTAQLSDENNYYDLLGFDNNFDYTTISSGMLPKLKNIDQTELLPNQNDILLEKKEFNIESVIIEPTVTNATLLLTIDNPANIEITGLEFDYLTVTKISKLNTLEGKTTIEIQVSPNRYYDSYVLTNILYKDATSANPKKYQKISKIDLQFYRTIATYEDWQSISRTTTENYRLTADIDFKGKANIRTNVTMARLEGQDNGYTLKNLNLTVTAGNQALIRKITASLKNVTFDNIQITNTGGGDYVNIIKLNYANMDQVKFSNITLHSPKSSYIAPVGYNRGQSLRNITIEHNDSKGVSFVSGFCSRSFNYDSYQFSANDITVYGSGRYVGGFFGYRDYIEVSNNFYYTASNMNVTGQSDVGAMFGYGAADFATLTDSKVYALAGGEYVGAMAGRNTHRYGKNLTVDNCLVDASSTNYVGGMFGWAYDVNYAYVSNTTVIQRGANKNYTGGIIGHKNGYSHNNMGIKDSTITSAGPYTGGIAGHLYGNLYYTYATNIEVTGVDRVGGVVGMQETGIVAYNVTNAKVIGTGNYVGGVVGYLNNVDELDSAYSGKANDIIVANTEVTGNNYVGGYAGLAPQQLTTKFFYRILLAVDLNSVATTNNIGILTGFDKTFRTPVPNTFVYESSTINGETVKNIANDDTIDKNNYITSSQLANTSFYTGKGFVTSRWDYTSLANYAYPKVTGGDGKVLAGQDNISLPVSLAMFRMRLSRSLGQTELPNFTIYSSGLNSINIEFDREDPYTYFEIYENGKKTVEQELTKRTLTLQYNYQSSLKIVLSDGLNRKVTLLDSTDLINTITTFDDKYAYLKDGKIEGNISPLEDTFVHLYHEKALTKDGSIYNLKTNKYEQRKQTLDLLLQQETTPLYQFNYQEVEIDTYANYSIIHKGGEDIIYEKQLFVKNNTLQIIDSSLDNVKTSVIIDAYAHHEYVTVLGIDGRLYHLKDKLQLPAAFINKNIKAMTSNINNNSSLILVLYENGKVVLFDYRTGSMKNLAKADASISLFSYLKENLTVNKTLIKDTAASYKESQELQKLLEEKPLAEGSDQLPSSDKAPTKVEKEPNYITYYNASKEDFDIIDINTVLEQAENVKPENDKIYASKARVDYYLQESTGEAISRHVNLLTVFVMIVIGIIISLLLWLKNAKRLKGNEEKL